MALTLQGLPTELLLCITDSITTPSTSDTGPVECGKPRTKRQLFKALRATCTELNGKLLHYFGSKYFTCFRIKLTEEDLLFLREVSRSPIGDYVREITIDVDTLFEQITNPLDKIESDDSVSDDSESEDSESEDSDSDGSEDFWAPESIEEDYHVGECVLDQSVVNVLQEGSCARLLCEALPALRNLRSLGCAPPSFAGRLEENNLYDIESAWWVACKELLKVIFTATLSVESLSIWSPWSHPLGLPLSLLEKPVVYPDWMSTVKDLTLYMVDDIFGEDTFPTIVRNLTKLFEKLKNMVHLDLYLTSTPTSFFSQLARTMPSMSLIRVNLYHTATPFEELDIFLRSTMSTLRSLGLSHTDLDDLQDFKELLSLLMSLKLTSFSFQSLNIGVHQISSYQGRVSKYLISHRGLSFWLINKMRPTVRSRGSDVCPHDVYDACDWAFVDHHWEGCDIFVNEEDDVDVIYWLKVVYDQVQLTDRHDAYELVDYEIHWPRR